MADLEAPEGKGGAARPRPIEEAEFADRVLGAKVPVIVVFTAAWCAPCKWLMPYLDAIAQEAEGRMLIYVLDTDRAADTAHRLGIASLPTSVFMRDGGEVDRSHGVEPERLRAWAAPFVSRAEELPEA